MSNLRIVQVTCKNVTEARKIGLSLLKLRLIACANIIPGVESMYLWPATAGKKGKIEKGSEALLMMKTTDGKVPELTERIEELHSYEASVIEVIAVDLHGEMAKKWLEEELGS